MRVRFRSTAAGPEGIYLAGTVHDLDDERAFALLAAGAVESVEPPRKAPVVERAVIPEAAEEVQAAVTSRKKRRYLGGRE